LEVEKLAIYKTNYTFENKIQRKAMSKYRENRSGAEEPVMKTFSATNNCFIRAVNSKKLNNRDYLTS
jgi:hypothetical protein